MAVDRKPFPLLDVLPSVLSGVILDFWWDRDLLWQLDLPVVYMAVADLDWHLQLPMWSFRGKPFVVTPEEVAARPDRFRDQYGRTLAADLQFPIHLLDKRHPIILDGLHRLLKAKMIGCELIPVKMLPVARLDEIAR